MDNAAGGLPRRPVAGRRHLRFGALTLGACLTMHCRIAASAFTGGFFIFILFLTLAVVLLANPLRHFEVYLGQWSISGPGRAFRIIPMFDGIGIAICINALVRAIICSTVAAIAALYVMHSVKDSKLPFTYCRDFELKPYDPIIKDIKSTESRAETKTILSDDVPELTTLGFYDRALRNTSFKRSYKKKLRRKKNKYIEICKESYNHGYPYLYSTPAFNFFYVEVLALRSDYSFKLNIPLVLTIILIWTILWFLLIVERLTYGRLVWNNTCVWLIVVPWIWVILVLIMAVANLITVNRSIRTIFRMGAKELLNAIIDAVEVALYIHCASTGTEIIHGKGLNHYASGHIDPRLNRENVWHSGLLLLLTTLHSSGAAFCAFVNRMQANQRVYTMYESNLWIIPMYSKCTLVGEYSHLLSTLIFGGLMFSYTTVAFMMLKTALHTIFEYRVKLVFQEQLVVAILIFSCMGLSMLLATHGGIPLLESVDAIMSGLSTPFVCLIEMIALLYVYRGHDFVSDMNLATEENQCASRLDTQWQIIPFITLILIIIKISELKNSELPSRFMYMALAPLVGILLAVPLRACNNAYLFYRSKRRRGT